MNKIVMTVVAIVTLALAILLPKYGMRSSYNTYLKMQSDLSNYNSIKANVDRSQHELSAAQDAFESARQSEIYYGDVERIVSILNNLTMLSVVDTQPYSVENYFTPAANDMYPTAYKISIVTNNLASTLSIIDRLELPVYNIQVMEPNMVDVIFLTGNPIS